MSTIDALIEERAAYLARGRKDRAAQVDAQIKALGGVEVAVDAPDEAPEPEPVEVPEPAPVETAAPKPRKRAPRKG